ncbi:MAG: ATP-dependent DNA helicase RecG [Bacillota bacterium]|nr:ATP-dependent DNA helicase RecG [Bacillota bacterium]
MFLEQSIDTLNKVGPKTKEKLNNLGIVSLLDLLLFFPRDYETIIKTDSLKELNSGDTASISGEVTSVSKPIRINGKAIININLKNSNGSFNVKYFNMPYIVNSYKIGEVCCLTGKVASFKGNNILINPSRKCSEDNNIKPIYSLTKGISNDLIINLLKQLLSKIIIKDNLPEYLISKNSLLALDNAIKKIHAPGSLDELETARKRLKYQELLTYSLKILISRKYIKENREGMAFNPSKELNLLKNSLPYKLTNAQSRVMREILIDEKSSSPMNRLIQGDVGSGKTVVALIALFNVIKNGYQGALMAPTEILANQHYNEAQKLLSPFKIRIQLLTGSTTHKNKILIKEKLKNGEIDLIIGTHALFTEDVLFENLGLVITDEQHRFGVKERNKFINKGKNIDVLVMTATPIPRTMSLYMFGDLDISVIDEMPPNRIKIDTYYVDSKERDRVYSFAKKEIAKGRQVYAVCPLVEENENGSMSVEELYKIIKTKYSIKNIQMLYGGMNPKEKDEVMKRFNDGEIDLLVSTTVIEVGINVKNAALMIVEGAERFGLSQLHQLRGRVGRGSEKSFCILIADIKNDKIKERLEILKNYSDGFKIAEEDLRIRGTGEIFGFRQSGDSSFIIADPYEDMELFKEANKDARDILESNTLEAEAFRNETENKIKSSSKFICFN